MLSGPIETEFYNVLPIIFLPDSRNKETIMTLYDTIILDNYYINSVVKQLYHNLDDIIPVHYNNTSCSPYYMYLTATIRLTITIIILRMILGVMHTSTNILQYFLQKTCRGYF